jgi:hypothetical protein
VQARLGGRAVAEEDVVGGVELDGRREVVDRFVIVAGRKGGVALGLGGAVDVLGGWVLGGWAELGQRRGGVGGGGD